MQKKRVFIFIACVVLLTAFYAGMVATATAPNQASGVIFKTPEDAITSYMDGVAHGDVQKILRACAVDEMSENFKFDLFIARVGALTPYQTLSPASSPFYVELNKAQITSQISNQVRLFTYGLLSTEKVSEGVTIIMDATKADNFMKALDLKRLAPLEIKKIGLPNKALMSTAKYLENEAKIAHVYGADESTERVAVFSFEQNYYFVGFMLLRYGEIWKISSQYSPIANLSGLGTPQKTTVEEFENLTNGK